VESDLLLRIVKWTFVTTTVLQAEVANVSCLVCGGAVTKQKKHEQFVVDIPPV
jgi:hypothetical protein